MNRIIVAAVTLLLLFPFVLVASAEAETVNLRYSFEDGEALKYTSRLQGKSVVNAAGMETSSSTEAVLESETRAKIVEPGVYSLETTSSSIRVVIDGREVPAPAQRKSEAVLHADGRVGGGESGQGTPYQLRMPDNPVSVGESWQHVQTLTFDVPTRELQRFDIRFVYQLQEIREVRGRRCAVIRARALGRQLAGGDIEIKVMGIGEIIFDIEKGRIVSASNSMRMEFGVDQPGRDGQKARILDVNSQSLSHIQLRE